MSSEPQQTISGILDELGEVGERLGAMHACEGAAGNISLYIKQQLAAGALFPRVEEISLPYTAPALAGGTLLVTGSGQRIPALARNPHKSIGVLEVQADGRTGMLYTAEDRYFSNLTSELNSHLAVHQQLASTTPVDFHALIHSHPFHLTYLSHLPEYQDRQAFNQRLLRWQPELIINFPDGIGLLPFGVPGSPALMANVVEGMATHRAVVWGKHGLAVRSDRSLHYACDLVEYLNTAARYELMNLSLGNRAAGLSTAEIKQVCEAFTISQAIY